MTLSRLVDRFVPAVLILMAALLAFIVLRGAVNIPYWDEWEWTDLVIGAHNHTLTLSQLWAQHNEHRMLTPQLFVVAIDKLRGWDTIEETLLNVTMVFATIWVALAVIRRTIAPPRQALVLLVTAVLLCSVRQQENFIWGFQIAWFMVELGIFSAVALLTRERREFTALFAAVVIGFATSYCMSSGLLVWPVGFIAIVLSTPPKNATARGDAILWVLAGIVATAIYFAGYQKPGAHPPLLFGVEHPFMFLQYVAAYLGSPFLLHPGDVGAAALVGLAGLLLFSVAVVARWRDPLAGPWIALGAFAVLGAFSTALGRAGFGVDQALASRYVTLSTSLWVALCCLLAQARYAAFPARRMGLLLLVVVAAPLFLRANVIGYKDQVAQKLRLVGAYEAALDPDTAPDYQLGVLYPAPGLARARLQTLRAIKDGPFLHR